MEWSGKQEGGVEPKMQFFRLNKKNLDVWSGIPGGLQQVIQTFSRLNKLLSMFSREFLKGGLRKNNIFPDQTRCFSSLVGNSKNETSRKEIFFPTKPLQDTF